uniref:Serine/threonine-protein phosphatase 2A activator n=1 Tax=Acrobeloides nanus TaxID=290746 RepID=A0A914DL14_9BILA
MANLTDFVVPKREILTVFDINKWYKSEAYCSYLNFLKRINNSVRGLPSTSDVEISTNVQQLINVLQTLDVWIEDFPPEDMGDQRFGNKAYRNWYARLEERAEELIKDILTQETRPALIEIMPYFKDSFGNSTRIDYGTGHEAAFLIFLLCLYKIGFLNEPNDDKAVVLRLFARYLKLVRRLQVVYRMEPAGSRGVHALDDYQFTPFMFGSSQLIGNPQRLIPDYYLKPEMVEVYQSSNLFFEAIQFINETKIGPFYEHSNQLYNISAVQTWEKVNSGMFKMYEGEVLKKFPVVQHFLFGNLFPIRPAEASMPAPTVPIASSHEHEKPVATLEPITE